jgi:crotonobetainyl-CoA:carnitine CoA-transferase CaiB-like acyl-CoA transferase
MSGPLEGINVVDCGAWLQEPMAAALLGDLGAEVIKIEERVKGDPLRGIMSATYQTQRQAQFETLNRSKWGITLDLTKQEGREIVYRLIEKSDVFMHNFRPQAARRLGLDYETVFRLNPRLVYAQASGWGSKGPDCEKGALDVAAAARTGMMELEGDPEMPRRTIGGICDVAGALCLALGILAALQARERIGRGQMVDTSLFGSTITLATFPVTHALAFGTNLVRGTRTEARNPFYNWYKCADGQWLHLLMLQAERYWPTFCQVAGMKELEKDPRFENLRAMIEHRGELVPILDRIFGTKPREEWIRIFAEQDLPCAPIKNFLELGDDPQALANDYIVEFDHPTYGREKVVGLPYKFSETAATLSRPCPELGQHTEEVLLELGYKWEDIARLKQAEVI